MFAVVDLLKMGLGILVNSARRRTIALVSSYWLVLVSHYLAADGGMRSLIC